LIQTTASTPNLTEHLGQAGFGWLPSVSEAGAGATLDGDGTIGLLVLSLSQWT
jgi:hypothetical protein